MNKQAFSTTIQNSNKQKLCSFIFISFQICSKLIQIDMKSPIKVGLSLYNMLLLVYQELDWIIKNWDLWI